ncbi:stage II sporulation protein M [Candidatus Woesearchaeota archaeon]|nr:stage II sporulation protein M [Candidatus Woesearchaeota archaeon]
MSIELILKPLSLERRPRNIFPFGLLFATIAVILTLLAFPRDSSILVVTFTVIPLVPIFIKIIEIEERDYERRPRRLFFRHNILQVYAWLFLSLIIGFSLWYGFLPEETSSRVFGSQLRALYDSSEGTPGQQGSANYGAGPVSARLCDSSLLSGLLISHDITDCVVSDVDHDGAAEYLVYERQEGRPFIVYLTAAGEYVSYRTFMSRVIILNNLQLLLFIFLTSFIFGAGALFALIWNASIIGVFVGASMRGLSGTLPPLAAYAHSLGLSLWTIALHGVPEMLGFFIGALSGGIVSVAVVRHGLSRQSLPVLKDSLWLFALAVGLIAIAGVIEVL